MASFVGAEKQNLARYEKKYFAGVTSFFGAKNEISEHGATMNISRELRIEVKGLEATKSIVLSELTIKNDGLEATKYFLSELTIKVDWRKATKNMFAFPNSNRKLERTTILLSELRIEKLETTKIILTASNDKKLNATKCNSPEKDISRRLEPNNISSEPDKANNLEAEAYTLLKPEATQNDLSGPGDDKRIKAAFKNDKANQNVLFGDIENDATLERDILEMKCESAG